MDSRTLQQVAERCDKEKWERHQANAITEEQSAALSAAAARVAEEDQRRYSENFQAQQQRAAQEGFMWPR